MKDDLQKTKKSIISLVAKRQVLDKELESLDAYQKKIKKVQKKYEV